MKDEDPIVGARPEKLDQLLLIGMQQAPDQADPAKSLEITERESTLSLNALAEYPGARVGLYKLLQVLGEGGMGVVFLAEQKHPIQRQVALKIIKPGMDSKQVIARFETEQQALAMMDHPHVAHVFDAGLAENGRPYFVMEYVRGIPITEHCDKNRLTVEARLVLFLRVCEAIQHAHQKGIVHRDLKPSNILVTIQDQEVVPKVIDFGVARAISQSLTEHTLYTEQGQLVGTPEYMSPEQADPSNQDIDTRTDVCSLGLLLYEFLAGLLPFDRRTFREGGIDNIRKVICEHDTATPSTKLSKVSLAESTELARRRQTDVRSLRHKLRGDLDWITLKAVEKDRTRRYASVHTMATDIRNYLVHQPVMAAPPSILYRIRKFTRRHRQLIAACAMVFIIVIVISWTLRTYIQSNKQRVYIQTVKHEHVLTQAQEAFDTRDFSGAERAVTSLLSSQQVGRRATLLYSQLLLEGQKSTDAITELEKLLKKSDDVAGQAHFILAAIYYNEASLSPEETPEAIRCWRYHSAEAEKLIGGTSQDYFLKASATYNIRETSEKDIIIKILQNTHYNKKKSAEILRMSRKTLYNKIEKYGIYIP